jgi:hypothetical protein
MTTKKLASVLAAAALLGTSYGAEAHVISLDPIIQKVSLGDTFEVDINMAFSEATLGGAFDLFYDPAHVEFVSFSFDDFFYNNVSDPAFDHAPDNCFTDGAPFGGCDVGDPELNAIGFGNFDGISGSYLVGTIVFRAVGAGASDLTMAVNDAPFEGFFSAETGLPMDVLYNSAKVDINAVPVPAAAWLLTTALGLLGTRRKR